MFMKEKFYMLMIISQKFDFQGPTINKSASFQVKICHWTSDEPFPEPIETVSPEDTFCDTVQVPIGTADMELI